MTEENESVSNPLDLLANAISDVGYWRWWTEQLPDLFQIEFGGVQLYFPPSEPGQTPSSIIAIGFEDVNSVCFMIKEDIKDFEWVKLLQQDKMDPITCTYDQFFFNNKSESKSLIALASQINVRYGGTLDMEDFCEQPYQLVFWCADYGLAIASRSVKVFSASGEVSLENVSDLNGNWWKYWNEYWEKKDTPQALPKDYACEVTIPVKEWRKY